MSEYKSEKSSETSNPDDRAIDHVVACKKESVDFYKDRFSKFNFFDKLYIEGAKKNKNPRGRANLKLPIAFQQIEPFVCQMTEAMVSEAPYIVYEGRTPDDDEPARQITDFTQYQLDRGEFIRSWTIFIRNLGKYGTSILKVIWDVDTKDVSKSKDVEGLVVNPDTGEYRLQTDTQEYQETITTFDGLRFINVSIFDFFVPKTASSTDVQKLDWCIHRTWRDVDALIKNPNYKNKDKLRQLRDGEGDYEYKGHGKTDAAKQTQLNQNNGKGIEKYNDQVEVLEWWGDYRLTEDGERVPTLIVVAIPCEGDAILLRCEENPLDYKFKPFVAANDYQIEGEFYGYGELDHLEDLITESTELRNARLDAAAMSLNQMWLVERQAGVNVRNLYSAPNHIIFTDDLNGLKPHNFAGTTPSSVEELGRIDYDIQNTTEIINPRQDVSNVGAAFGGTATGVNFLSAKSNLRMMLKTRLLEFTFFKPLALLINMYNKQFVTDQMEFRVMGDEGPNPYSSVGPEAFNSEIDYKAKSAPEKLSTQEKRQNMDYLLQVVAQIEGVKPGTVDFSKLMPEVFKIAGFPHPQSYILPQQTTVLALPNGQFVDATGKPVQVVPTDETGKPMPQPPAPGMMPIQ